MINPSGNSGIRDPDVTIRRILKVNPVDAIWPSDHYGVMVDIDVRPNVKAGCLAPS
ncbi:hypothetical protein [Rhizobium hidalgonense]|uniref:hypothetical protein n=1 Tax=Rhizobium hidalgonense TaxID=1538159 RepID=UPI00027D2D01|nr:hypothetical protein [Rhizobium hidalgonense]EJC76663.1 hypothetical protein Rleg10DRAFT_5346 [Rhizobium leguminosarum bv. trifolii WSM2012]MDR9803322.1 hypothetical protein [Rhizobium hidalgonense]